MLVLSGVPQGSVVGPLPCFSNLQWNLQTTDTLGMGVLSAVERLLSRRFANKPCPSSSILRSQIDRRALPAAFLCRHALNGPKTNKTD